MSADEFSEVSKDLESFLTEPQGAPVPGEPPFTPPQGGYAKGGTIKATQPKRPVKNAQGDAQAEQAALVAPPVKDEVALRDQLRAELRREIEAEVRAEIASRSTVNVMDGFFAPDGVSVSPTEEQVLVHFIDDGFTIGGRMFYRGEETLVPASTPWLALNSRQQIRQYGKRIFRTGPWDGEGFDLTDPALTAADRVRLAALETAQV